MSISLKVTLKDVDNDVTEVRRFAIDLDESQPSLIALQQKLVKLFPNQLICKDYRIKWKDSDSDWVTVLSDEELSLALKELAVTARLFLVEISNQNSSKFKVSGKRKEIHVGITCNGCGNNIAGFRYKCIICPSYDLCSLCEAGGHHQSHYMMRIATPEDAWPLKTFWRLEPLKEPHCFGPCTCQTWSPAMTHGRKTIERPSSCKSDESCSTQGYELISEPLQNEKNLHHPVELAASCNQHSDTEYSHSDSDDSQPERQHQVTAEILPQQATPDTTCNQKEPDQKATEKNPPVEPDIQDSSVPTEHGSETAVADQASADQTDKILPDQANVSEPVLEETYVAGHQSEDMSQTEPVIDPNFYSEPIVTKDNINSVDGKGDNHIDIGNSSSGVQQSCDGTDGKNMDSLQFTDQETKGVFKTTSSSSSSSSSAEDILNETIPYVTIHNETIPDETVEDEDDQDSSMPAGFEAASLKQVSSAHSLNNINEPLGRKEQYHGDPYHSEDGIPSGLGQAISTYVSVYNLNDGDDKTRDSGKRERSKR